MPKLTIVIGANGAGKSTWSNEHRTKRLPTDFYNADSIAQGLGDWNSPRKQRAAREVVDHNIRRHLTERTDFGFESTYSGSSRPDIVRRAKEAGYTIEAIFVGTTRPEINVKRVATRVAARTGHDVPKKEIHRRWKAAQDNLAATAKYIDEIEVLDNSGRTRRSVVRIKEGRITERESRVPRWAAQLAARATEATTPGPRQRQYLHTPSVRPPDATAQLHPLSKVHPTAQIGARVIIEAGAEVQRGAKIGEDTIVRSGSCVREGSRIGAGCDIAAFYVGRDAKLGNGINLHAGSGVGDNTTIGDAVDIKPGARVGRNVQIHERAKLGPKTYVHPGATLGDSITTGKNVRINENVRIGDGATLADETRIAPNAIVGNRTNVGKNVRIGMDASAGTKPSATIGNNCTLGDKSRVSGNAQMKDGCTLKANAHLEHGAVMEAGSTVCSGSKVQQNVVIREGVTIPPSTLVKTAGVRVALPTNIDDDNFRDNDDDREVHIHPDDAPRGLPETPPATPAPAAGTARRTDGPSRNGPAR